MFTEIFIDWIIIAIMEVVILNCIDANPMTMIGTVIGTFISIVIIHMLDIYKNYRKEGE